MNQVNNNTINYQYNADNIKVLEGLEAVRMRPAMYIGNVEVEGLHHLVYEVVDNSIDEAMAGYCDTIHVTIHTDNSVTVEDNGRGIPVDLHEKENIPAVEVVMTKLHSGGKFDNDSYKVSGGLHGVGISVVNALSILLEVEIFKDGHHYYQQYSKGNKVTELIVRGETQKRGTTIHFKPDTEIINTNEFNFEVLSKRLKELAFLNRGIRIRIEDERSEEKQEFYYTGGLSEFVVYLNRLHTAIHEPIIIEGDKNDVQIEVAIQYNDTYTEKLYSFANNINTIEGGAHLSGFKGALTRTLNNYLSSDNIPKNLQAKISGEDVREGLTAIISVRLKHPQFEGQTKTKLGNSEVKGYVESLVNEKLAHYLDEKPNVSKIIITKVVEAARARDAAKRARDLVRSKSTVFDSTLPGKLAECQNSKPEDREIFFVEGDSAGGSAKQGRDRRFQAILPLKGKILNVEKSRFDKLLKSEEIKNIITVLGTGVGDEDYDIENIRYHKVIIMTDADVDGSHIRTLLLTFFFRQIPDIIKHGHLYIAQPPLYKLTKGKTGVYLKDDDAFQEYLFKKICDQKKVMVNNNELSKHEMYQFLKNMDEYFKVMAKLEKYEYDISVIEMLIHAGVRDKSFLHDQEKMTELNELLVKKGYITEGLHFNDTYGIYEIFVTKKTSTEQHESAKDKSIKIGTKLIYSVDYQNCLMLKDKMKEYQDVPFNISNASSGEEDVSGESLAIDTIKDLYSYLMKEGKKGITIQRYKGLGEMNPDQLWETTMNPDTRHLLQVKIDDLERADEIFTLLMGEEVEPRRDFIRENALEVSFLDV
ncbi:MAG: DNA topoisomerase (ATP-hydrolyzing) subunit B [Desulfobacterales bacterium]|nr:DNA topoisomerase (ATP-hydrolyzing) subunit B [Desulfobacterales bacterium]